MGSLNGDIMVIRNGRSTSQISVYNYPEHLNPFYEDDQHKRLRFWKINKKDSEGRRNSFSFGNLRDMWTFKSFRSNKRSSTLGINKTSESPPMLRREFANNNGWNTFDNRLRASNTSSLNYDNFQRNATYRSSLQTLPTNNDRIGMNRNDGYRSTIQVTRLNPRYHPQQQKQPTTGVSQNRRCVYGGSVTPQPLRNSNVDRDIMHKYDCASSIVRRSSHSSSLSTNPFESDDDDDDDDIENKDINTSGMKSVNGGSISTLTSRTPRKKRRAPAPPTPIHGRGNGAPPPTIVVESSQGNTDDELHIKEDIDIANLTAEIESFVNIKNNDNVKVEEKTNIQKVSLETSATSASSTNPANNDEQFERDKAKTTDTKAIDSNTTSTLEDGKKEIITPTPRKTSKVVTASDNKDISAKGEMNTAPKTGNQVTTEIVTVITKRKTQTIPSPDMGKTLDRKSSNANATSEIVVTRVDESKEIKANGAIPKKPNNDIMMKASVDQGQQQQRKQLEPSETYKEKLPQNLIIHEQQRQQQQQQEKYPTKTTVVTEYCANETDKETFPQKSMRLDQQSATTKNIKDYHIKETDSEKWPPKQIQHNQQQQQQQQPTTTTVVTDNCVKETLKENLPQKSRRLSLERQQQQPLTNTIITDCGVKDINKETWPQQPKPLSQQQEQQQPTTTVVITSRGNLPQKPTSLEEQRPPAIAVITNKEKLSQNATPIDQRKQQQLKQQSPTTSTTATDLSIKEAVTEDLPQKPTPLKRLMKAEPEIGHVECIHVHIESPRATPPKDAPNAVSTFKTSESVDVADIITTKTPFILTNPPAQIRRTQIQNENSPVIKETVKYIEALARNERSNELNITEEPRTTIKPAILTKPTLSPKPIATETNSKIHGFAEIHKPMRSKIPNLQNGHVRRASREDSVSLPILQLQKVNNSAPPQVIVNKKSEENPKNIKEVKINESLKILETSSANNGTAIAFKPEKQSTVTTVNSVTNHNVENKSEEDFDTLYRSKAATHMEWKHSTLAPLETNIPPEKRKSVKEIIESINRSQRLLHAAANKDFTALPNTINHSTTAAGFETSHKSSLTNSNKNNDFNEDLKILDETQREINRMVEELSPTATLRTNFAGKTFSSTTPPSPSNHSNEYNSETQKLDNNDIFQKCKVNKEVYDYRESSPISSNLDWNPLPKPKRTKPGYDQDT